MPGSDHDLRDVAVELLYAELRRREDNGAKPACGTTGRGGSYNVLSHVLAVVLIFVISTIGILPSIQYLWHVLTIATQHAPSQLSHEDSLFSRSLIDSSSSRDISGPES